MGWRREGGIEVEYRETLTCTGKRKGRREGEKGGREVQDGKRHGHEPIAKVRRPGTRHIITTQSFMRVTELYQTKL